MPCGSVGDLTTTSRHKASDKHNIKNRFGDSLGGAVALELQNHQLEMNERRYSAPVIDLKGAVQPTWNANTEGYRNLRGQISMFDSPTIRLSTRRSTTKMH